MVKIFFCYIRRWTYFRLRLKRNDLNECGEKRQFFAASENISAKMLLFCSNAAAEGTFCQSWYLDKKYTSRNLNHNDARGRTCSRQNNIGTRRGWAEKHSAKHNWLHALALSERAATLAAKGFALHLHE